MASSGVWENFLLCKTPTLDGVCRIFIFIIFYVIFLIGRCNSYMVEYQMWCHMLATIILFCGRWYCHFVSSKFDSVQMLLSMWQMESHFDDVVADVIAIVADGIAT